MYALLSVSSEFLKKVITYFCVCGLRGFCYNEIYTGAKPLILGPWGCCHTSPGIYGCAALIWVGL